MSGVFSRVALAAALVVSGLLVASSGEVAQAATNQGTILMTSGKNILSLDGAGNSFRWITSDGGTQTADQTGGPEGYVGASQANNGTIVAARDQSIGGGHHTDGYLWVFDRYGKVLRKFDPPQFTFVAGSSPCGSWAFLPAGIVDTRISPDGKYIAYTAMAYQTYNGTPPYCQRAVYMTRVVTVTGQDVGVVKRAGGDQVDLMAAHWTSNTRLLVHNNVIGDDGLYYTDLPSLSAKLWLTYEQYNLIEGASVRGGRIAGSGYDSCCGSVIGVATTSGPPNVPTHKCNYWGSVDPKLSTSRPSLSPDGKSLIWMEADGNSSETGAGEGVYAADLTNMSGCPDTVVSLMAGASDPYWSAAAYDGPATVKLTGPTAAFTATGSTKVTWSGSGGIGGIKNYQLRWRRAAWNGDFPSTWTVRAAVAASTKSWSPSSLADGSTYCYQVRAKDAAGTWTAYSAQKCTSTPLDDRSLSASAGWTRSSSSAFFKGTYTSSSTLNKTLTRANARIKRVGVLVSTCSTCGKIGVYVGSTLVGTINTAQATAHYKVIKGLSPFALKTATVTLKQVSSGKPVRVDGLFVSHE